MCPDFAKQVAEIEYGLRPPVISVGNLEARRDFSDVRDIVRAYELALEHSLVGVPVNVASGRSHAIQEVLDSFLQLSQVPIDVQRDPERLRPSDVPVMLGDASLLHKQFSAFLHNW